ncbi:MAG: hypothetical protein MSIBF_02155 [Candidatus Altiarchaeales archaeon IMC4]|nr:MAG: hypothetical protein MSIBF_02155 [Candidatus Altiarchaeales archaeon IMC4]
MKENNIILKAIIIASLIGVVFIAGLILGNKGTISGVEDAGFIEIYFEDIESLPHEVMVGETYPVSFTMVSHEPAAGNYAYSIESGISNLTGNLKLSPGEEKTISVNITTKETLWKFEKSRTQGWNNSISLTNETWFGGQVNLLELLLRGNASLELIDVAKHLPIASNVDHFGAILFTNLSIEELRKKPLRREYAYEDINEGVKYQKLFVVELSVNGNELLLDSTQTETWYKLPEEKFSVTVVSPEGKQYEIHFWHTVS